MFFLCIEKEIKGDVEGYIEKQPKGSKVRIAGHSLGGGVAQHAMHDIKDPNKKYDAHVKSTTFDAPGTESSIEGFDEKRVSKDDAKNIVIEGSLVSEIGGKHVGDVKVAKPSSSIRVGKEGWEHNDALITDHEREEPMPRNIWEGTLVADDEELRAENRRRGRSLFNGCFS